MLDYDDLKKYDVIFCDMFDTFIYRNVSPEYVKKIWCNHIVKMFEIPISMEDLYFFRNQTESELCNENVEKGNDLEFKYNNLIEKIYQEYECYLKDIPFEKFLDLCLDTEVSIEKQVQYLDEKIIDILKKCKKNGKKIYCVSDMYLPKNAYLELFKYHKIDFIFDDIFVSCENLLNKKSGRLYQYVLKTLNVKPEKCVMFGDNLYSDFEIPTKNNIKSFHLDRKEMYEKYKQFDEEINSKNIKNEFNLLCKTNSDNFEHIIFSLYLFTEQLYFNLLKEGKDEVIFLSREGEFLKKIFDVYVSKVKGKHILSKYAIVSRKSTYLPSLKNIKDENFDSLLGQYSYISVEEFLKSLNFNDNEIKLVVESFIDKPKKEIISNFCLNDDEINSVGDLLNLDFKKKIGWFDKSSTFKRLLKNEKFCEIFEKRRVEQNKNFKKYISDLTSSKKIAIVDIGWNGSIQNNIQNILGKDYEIDGYYLGLQKRDGVFEKNKFGLIFSNVPTLNKTFKLYSTNRAIYEILLGASHGSANEYVEKNGKVDVELFSKKEEKDIFENCISKIQERMLNVFEQLCDLLCNGFYDNIEVSKKINQLHFNMMYNPNKSQLNFFNNIYHYENFGVFEFTSFNSKGKISFLKKIKEYVKFVRDFKNYFNDAFWPILKLSNNNMKLAMFLYRNLKKMKFKKEDIL